MNRQDQVGGIVMIAIFEGLFQPQHLLVLGIITFLLIGKRLPEIARFLGTKIVNIRFRKKIWPDDERQGGALSRLEPPDKPRPPAQVALAPPKSSEDQPH